MQSDQLKEGNMSKVLGLMCVGILGIPMTVWAGVVFHLETSFPNQGKMAPKIGSMMVEGNRLKMNMKDEGNTQPTVIYRGDRKEMLMINHGDRSWRAMDKATMATLSQQLNPAMEQMQKRMEEALKNVPPERRAMMEKMLASQGIGSSLMGEKPEIQVKKTGETQTINGYPCVKYETWQDNEKVAEHWVTDWNRIPGSREAQAVFQDMAAFSQELWQGAFKGNEGPASFFEGMGNMDGYPVVTSIFSDGKIVTESRLTAVEEKSVPAHEFEPPKGYVQKEFLPTQPSGQERR